MKCKWCGTEGLVWRQVEGRWRLMYADGSSHLCRATRDKLAKKIKTPSVGVGTAAVAALEKSVPVLTQEQRLLIGFTKEGVKLILADMNKPEEVVPEDMNDRWWDWLNKGEKVIEEALP